MDPENDPRLWRKATKSLRDAWRHFKEEYAKARGIESDRVSAWVNTLRQGVLNELTDYAKKADYLGPTKEEEALIAEITDQLTNFDILPTVSKMNLVEEGPQSISIPSLPRIIRLRAPAPSESGLAVAPLPEAVSLETPLIRTSALTPMPGVLEQANDMLSSLAGSWASLPGSRLWPSDRSDTLSDAGSVRSQGATARSEVQERHLRRQQELATEELVLNQTMARKEFEIRQTLDREKLASDATMAAKRLQAESELTIRMAQIADEEEAQLMEASGRVPEMIRGVLDRGVGLNIAAPMNPSICNLVQSCAEGSGAAQAAGSELHFMDKVPSDLNFGTQYVPHNVHYVGTKRVPQPELYARRGFRSMNNILPSRDSQIVENKTPERIGGGSQFANVCGNKL